MVSPPKVSVLLPTHNRADVLPFSIQSVLSQSFADFELLIVGDGCTDNTAEVVAGFGDNRIKWFDLPKGSHFGYDNRNIVLKKAKGEFIAYMAHDDLITRDHLSSAMQRFDENEQLELVLQKPLFVNRKAEIIPTFFNINGSFDYENYVEGRKTRFPSACTIHKKSCLENYGYWNAKLSHGGDWDLCRRIIKGKTYKNFLYTNQATIFHFKAIWRKDDPSKKGGVFRRFFFGNDNEYLKVFKPDYDGQVSEQEFLWNLFQKDIQFIPTLRSNLSQIQDFYISILEQKLKEKQVIINDLKQKKHLASL